MLNSILKLFKNKVIIYLSTRYLVYGIQFLSLFILADKLGSFYYGIWSFIILIISYFRIINFGISNSINVILVQYKSDKSQQADYIMSGLLLNVFLALLVGIVALFYYIHPLSIFQKYNIGDIFYIVCIIGIFQYFNYYLCSIYRVNNRIYEISFYQSVFPIGVLIMALIFKEDLLLKTLIGVYVIGNVITLLVFIFFKGASFNGKVVVSKMRLILVKGIYLFLYNSAYSFILITTSTLISKHYSVREYGFYSFSYTLGHCILLLLSAFTFIIFPKIIDKFYSGDRNVVLNTLKSLRINYVLLAHGLMYIAFIFFPLIIWFFPKYSMSLMSMKIVGLAILLSTNSFGFNTYLIAQNKERLISSISLIVLVLNITIGFVIIKLGAPFYIVPFNLLISYFVFAYLCAFFANKKLERSTSILNILKDIFPWRMFIPYMCALFISFLTNNMALNSLPLIIFYLLNIGSIKIIFETIKSIRVKPSIVDLKK